MIIVVILYNSIFFNFLQASELTFDDIVKPAPVQRRPLEIIYNPYPTSCSKFCNHPIDRDLRQEYRDVIKKAKEGVVCFKWWSSYLRIVQFFVLKVSIHLFELTIILDCKWALCYGIRDHNQHHSVARRRRTVSKRRAQSHC